MIPRAEHTVSRRDIDPDALKVLYRLRQLDYIAYLVGGSVRDLLLGRHPKDFDIGTSAHPFEVKKLFRNCWIIGRRFRLAHVKFGTKVIEVATFRRQVQPGEEIVQDGVPAPVAHPEAADAHVVVVPEPPADEGAAQAGRHGSPHLIHRDNTFGTPEEDAFRRDFTINALFYDIATFAIIDYVGGLEDLRAGVVRSIGDPEVRFREDPVRMMRAVALAARLGFTIDPPIVEAIRLHRRDIAHSSLPRLLEEYYKILRSGFAEGTFTRTGGRGPARTSVPRAAPRLDRSAVAFARGAGCLSPSLPVDPGHAHQLDSARDDRSSPLNLLPQPGHAAPRRAADADDRYAPGPRLGDLPLARRDIERLRQILGLQRRLREFSTHPRVQRSVASRSVFREALTWLEIHGDAPELVAQWQAFAATREDGTDAAEPGAEAQPSYPRRRRRRRRRYRPTPER